MRPLALDLAGKILPNGLREVSRFRKAERKRLHPAGIERYGAIGNRLPAGAKCGRLARLWRQAVLPLNMRNPLAAGETPGPLPAGHKAVALKLGIGIFNRISGQAKLLR